MLWYKSWLETRFRMVMVLGFFVVLMVASGRTGPSYAARERFLTVLTPLIWAMFSVMLAGAGIKTQSIFQTTKGLHGSMYFTLSMPVSRLRLLAVRAGLGILEIAGVIATGTLAIWATFPILRPLFTRSDTVEFFFASVVCASSFYFISVFFATFLDDLGQIWISFIAVLSLRFLLTTFHVPPSLNVFEAMGDSSPLFTHTLPLASMGVSLAVAAILFLASLKVVQMREY